MCCLLTTQQFVSRHHRSSFILMVCGVCFFSHSSCYRLICCRTESVFYVSSMKRCLWVKLHPTLSSWLLIFHKHSAAGTSQRRIKVASLVSSQKLNRLPATFLLHAVQQSLSVSLSDNLLASQLLSPISQDVPDELVFILKVTHNTRNNSCAEVRFPAWIIVIPVCSCILLAWLFPVLCVTFHVLLPAFVCFLNLYAPQLFCLINCVFSSHSSCLCSFALTDFCFVAWVLTFLFLFLILYFCICLFRLYWNTLLFLVCLPSSLHQGPYKFATATVLDDYNHPSSGKKTAVLCV